MISSEVQRTLVKSPPELWAELSDPDALARHLGELGEIRITHTEPETTVEWEAQNASGTVSIKPSGWGTTVRLTLTREIAEPTHADEPTDAHESTPTPEPTGAEESMPAQAPTDAHESTPTPEPTDAQEPMPETTGTIEAVATPAPTATTEPAAVPEPPAVPEPAPMPARPAAAEPAPGLEPEPPAAAEPAPAPEPEPEPAQPAIERERRRGFFARLFGRGRRAAVEREREAPEEVDGSRQGPEPRDPFSAVSEALEPETFAALHPFAALPADRPAAADAAPGDLPASAGAPETEAASGGEAQSGQIEDISAELMAAEEVAAEEVAAMLTAVLDRLGAAHHRPFSRA